ncbi:MAG TPA: sulfotransferase [Candidatus Stackebrandtia faecavium]|nr:sulfotransferase [Candidatus Stackebrandtia faecavium]
MPHHTRRTPVLFIGGLGHSGTTLIEQLIGQLPKAVPLGEVARLWDHDGREGETCACGASFGACEFWQRIGAAAFDGWERLDRDRIRQLRAGVDRTRHIPALAGRHLKGAMRDAVAEYSSYYQRLYAAAAADSRAELVIDSSKHPSLAYCLRWCEDIDLRVLHVVRDPRGVAHSWGKDVAGHGMGANDHWERRCSPARAAMLWNAQNAAFDVLRRRGTVPVMRVHYEELFDTPRDVIADIVQWAQLPFTPNQLRFIGDTHADLGPSHCVAGDPMRFAVGNVALEPEPWEEELSPSRRRLVSTMSAPLLRRYGYGRQKTQPAQPKQPLAIEPRRADHDVVEPLSVRDD